VKNKGRIDGPAAEELAVQRINPWGGRGEGKQQEYHRVVGIISVIFAALNSQWLGGITVGMG
jgi:hypothetical protein